MWTTVNRTAKTVPEAAMAPNETLTLHFADDLAVVVDPHACRESRELQRKEHRFAIGRTDGVNVLTSRKQGAFESQLGILCRTHARPTRVI
jgi:hypothetical protein